LHKTDDRHRNTSVAFTLTDTQLITLREREIPAFRLMRMRARRLRGLAEDPISILLALFEIKIDDLADTLEEVYTQLEETSNLVLEDNDSPIEDALDELARQEDTNGKVRLCLMDTQRALSFILRRGKLSAEHAETARELLRDIDSLLPHNSFVFDKINFLMDAAQGFISIKQSKIIKIFSIAAVVFLPPTVIASIYGMNFAFMPELSWAFGYPFALSLMVLSGVAPYLFFKLKGWL
jgi:magnesium transporter